jgi:hypothetical protein
MSSRLRAMGPFTELTASCPDKPDVISRAFLNKAKEFLPDLANAVGNRPKDGRKVKIPVQAAGIRKEPPRS